MIRRFAMFVLCAGICLPNFAARRVTVEQLEQTAGELQGKPDADIARQLSDLELTERISPARFTRAACRLPGGRSREALVILAARSAFLDLPAAEIPSNPTPDLAEQRRIMALAGATGRAIEDLPLASVPMGILGAAPTMNSSTHATSIELGPQQTLLNDIAFDDYHVFSADARIVPGESTAESQSLETTNTGAPSVATPLENGASPRPAPQVVPPAWRQAAPLTHSEIPSASEKPPAPSAETPQTAIAEAVAAPESKISRPELEPRARSLPEGASRRHSLRHLLPRNRKSRLRSHPRSRSQLWPRGLDHPSRGCADREVKTLAPIADRSAAAATKESNTSAATVPHPLRSYPFPWFNFLAHEQTAVSSSECGPGHFFAIPAQLSAAILRVHRSRGSAESRPPSFRCELHAFPQLVVLLE
jgi:hypothetical protein